MNNIIINRKNRTITISKNYEKKACVYGSPEYKKLTSAQKDNPGFRLIVKNPPKNSLKSLTLKDMRIYLLMHGESDNLTVLEKLCAIGAEFPRIKKWFIEEYPDFSQQIDDSVISFVKNTTDDSTVA